MENRSLNNVENVFLNKVKNIEKMCTGVETFGNMSEFYDEDGVILMTAQEDENSSKIIFNFTSDLDESFEMNKVSDEEELFELDMNGSCDEDEDPDYKAIN